MPTTGKFADAGDCSAGEAVLSTAAAGLAASVGLGSGLRVVMIAFASDKSC
jgi:hypothetical protein